MVKYTFKKKYSFRAVAIKTSVSEAKKVFNQIDSGEKSINKHRRITKYNKRFACVCWNDYGNTYNVYVYRDKKNRIYVVDNPGWFYLLMAKIYIFIVYVLGR